MLCEAWVLIPITNPPTPARTYTGNKEAGSHFIDNIFFYEDEQLAMQSNQDRKQYIRAKVKQFRDKEKRHLIRMEEKYM